MGGDAMTSIKSSRDVIIRTERWPEALRFYEEVLGFTVASRNDAMAGFETGAFRLYVEAGEPHGPVFDFLTTDVAATKARLLARGCTLIEENPDVPRCYLRDPFGVVFNVGRAP
jgi:catechol 2,3-dioxygenase-like lactoylglutathione lyase family enzyme